MRRLLLWLTVLALLLGGLWLGGESLLARELRRYAAQEPAIQVGALHEMRRPGRIGVSAAGVELMLPAGRLALPETELWLSPLHPTTLRLDLPASAAFDTGRGPRMLGLTDTHASLRLRPLAGAEVGAFDTRSGPLTLDGAPLAKGFDARADLAEPGIYDVTLTLRELAPEALAVLLPLPGKLNLAARGRLWLDRTPSPLTLTPETMPLPVGLRLDGAELTLGRLSARIRGEIRADAQGRAEGVLAVYTPDARPFLDAAAEAGLIPRKIVVLAGTMLRNISELPMPEAGMDFPASAAGELRLPLRMAEGKISLGPLPLGPAPTFPRR
ncbi:DUF2125 domain-containing protein [Paracoccus aminovorans]|uniref:DUF2125 domain-containing protein n=1 Tax=Paracoccus aminovorans TaxID=34004 RepID=UPI002B25F9D7|nr:DUF2125 domain-containing protein [Paracoccus aminovorans]